MSHRLCVHVSLTLGMGSSWHHKTHVKCKQNKKYFGDLMYPKSRYSYYFLNFPPPASVHKRRLLGEDAICSRGLRAILIIVLPRLPHPLYPSPLFFSWYFPAFNEHCCSVGAECWALMWCYSCLGVKTALTERGFSLGKGVLLALFGNAVPGITR